VAKPLPQTPQAPVQQQQRAGAGCDAVCKILGVSKSCSFLVHFAATRSFAHKPDRCKLAHAVVRSQCAGSCNGCMLDATGCK
jgi:hypothetical protein